MDWIKIKTRHVSRIMSFSDMGRLLYFQTLIAHYERDLTDSELKSNLKNKREFDKMMDVFENNDLDKDLIVNKILEDVASVQIKRTKDTERKSSNRQKPSKKASVLHPFSVQTDVKRMTNGCKTGDKNHDASSVNVGNVPLEIHSVDKTRLDKTILTTTTNTIVNNETNGFVVKLSGNISFTKSDMVRGMILIPEDSPFFDIDKEYLCKLVEKYGVENVLDCMFGLEEQYMKNKKEIQNAKVLLTSALKNGFDLKDHIAKYKKRKSENDLSEVRKNAISSLDAQYLESEMVKFSRQHKPEFSALGKIEDFERSTDYWFINSMNQKFINNELDFIDEFSWKLFEKSNINKSAFLATSSFFYIKFFIEKFINKCDKIYVVNLMAIFEAKDKDAISVICDITINELLDITPLKQFVSFENDAMVA